MLEKGFIFSFEGGEGSGKSTVIKEVEKKLIEKGYDVLTTREPGGCKIAEKIRNVLFDNDVSDIDNLTELLLFLAARNEHYLHIIKPAIESGKIVLCDRFVDSTLVYQSMSKGLDYTSFEANIEFLHRTMFKKKSCLKYDIFCKNFVTSFYLQLSDAKIGLDRINSSNREKNRYDNKDLKFHGLVKESFDYLYENFPKHREIINADNDIDIVVKNILDSILSKINYENFLNLNVKKLIDLEKSQKINYVYFWKADYRKFRVNQLSTSVFSQWHLSDFNDGQYTYNCAEQYMMAQKAKLFDDADMFKLIMSTTKANEMKAYGRRVKNFDSKTWDCLCDDIVYRANELKFNQNEELKKYLLSFPENTVFVEASPYDKIWGIGMEKDEEESKNPEKWKGENKLGFVITTLFHNLKNIEKQ